MSRTRSFRPAALFARPTLAFLTLLIALVLSGFSARQAHATVHFVTTTGTGNGSTWAMAGPLQTIINAAHSGDQVWVEKGAYIGNFTATDGVAVYGGFNGTETMLSQSNPARNVTILDASNGGTVYTIPSAATGTNTLYGFTLENGTNGGINDSSHDKLVVSICTISGNSVSAGDFGTVYGGGVYTGSNVMATFTNSAFIGNTAYTPNGGSAAGGGLYALGPVAITTCSFVSNNAETGGGLQAKGATTTIMGSMFSNNTGSGAEINGTATITSTTFSSNTDRGIQLFGGSSTVTGCKFTGNSTGNGLGGGIYDDSPFSTISGCTFTSNYVDAGFEGASQGGAIYTATGTISTIMGCTFTANSAYPPNGGSAFGGSITALGTPTIADCKFSSGNPDEIDLESAGTSSAPAFIIDSLIYGSGTNSNSFNGIDVGIQHGSSTYAYATISNNTILNNAVGINIRTSGGAVSVANNILYANYGGLNGNSGITFASSHNDIYGNSSYGYQVVTISTTDLAVNPMFVRNPNFTSMPADYGDQHLKPGSPLLNMGDVSYVSSGDTALDGNDRTVNNKVDIGSYEGTIDPEPSITSFAPMSGPVGTVVTITGTNLAGVTSVLFDGTAATVFSVNAGGTQVTATVPSGAATGTIFITAATGSVPTATPFTISSTPATPTITSFTPTSGPVGIVVTATGTNLAGVTAVMFSGASATTFSANAAGTMLTVTVPTGAGTGAFTVTTPNGSVQTSTAFTVTSAAPTITGFTPASGPVGTSVVITGTNFTGATVVGFTGAHASFTVNSATQITATVPSGATTGPIAVATAGGTAHSSASFTVTGTTPAPTITSFTPTSGPVGTTVTITGTNFTGATVVGFTGAHATFTVNSATQITATVPTGATTGPIAVQTAGGTAHSSASFTVIVMLPTVQSLAFSPSTIAPGASSTGTVTLSGPAPAGGSVVTILLDSFTFDTVTVAAGHTTGTFTATASATAPAGTYVFTASYNSTSKSATLTVN